MRVAGVSRLLLGARRGLCPSRAVLSTASAWAYGRRQPPEPLVAAVPGFAHFSGVGFEICVVCLECNMKATYRNIPFYSMPYMSLFLHSDFAAYHLER